MRLKGQRPDPGHLRGQGASAVSRLPVPRRLLVRRVPGDTTGPRARSRSPSGDAGRIGPRAGGAHR